MEHVISTAATTDAPAAAPPRGRVSKLLIPEVIFGIGTLAESAVRFGASAGGARCW